MNWRTLWARLVVGRLVEGRGTRVEGHSGDRLSTLDSRRPPSGFVTEYDGEQPAWAPEMADSWRVYLGTTEAGKTLRRLANYQEQQTNRAAVFRSRESGADQNVGYARGWHDATAYFFLTLSADARPQQGTDTQATDDAGALRERLAS